MDTIKDFWNKGLINKIALSFLGLVCLPCILCVCLITILPGAPPANANTATPKISSLLPSATFTKTVEIFTTATLFTSPTFTNTPPSLITPTIIFQAIPGASCIPNNTPQTGMVVKVVDGDTIKVRLDQDGLVYSVRYIGMDTPENTTSKEFFGQEASDKNAELVANKSVIMIKDVSETDRYDRLLRYILVGDIFVNYELVAQGYANAVSYPPDTACLGTFRVAEADAAAAHLGFWAITPTPPHLVTVTPLATLTQFPLATATLSGSAAPCNCTGPDLDCADFGTHASAQACYNYCVSQGYGDVFRLDRDNDGLACESLP